MADLELLNGLNADVSDALDHLAAGRVARAVTAFEAMADAVRGASAEAEIAMPRAVLTLWPDAIEPRTAFSIPVTTNQPSPKRSRFSRAPA